MLSNTTKRLLSAAVLIFTTFVCIVLGRDFVNAFILILGIFGVDEVYSNFFKQKRYSFLYILSLSLFLIPFVYLNYVNISFYFYRWAVYLALFQNFILIVYLFFPAFLREENISGEKLSKIEYFGEKMPWISGFFFLFPLLSLSALLSLEHWKALLSIFLVIVFGMDTGAWFFGSKFGSVKLWERISPKKTFEGLLGGIFVAGLLSGIGWQIYFASLDFFSLALFCFLGMLGQIGDLVQSKIKRQVKLKNSSGIIPGHGGVYDRIDSLLFLAPFFLVVLECRYPKLQTVF